MVTEMEYPYIKKLPKPTAWGRFTITTNGEKILEGLVKGGKTGNNLARGDKYYLRGEFGGKPMIYPVLYGINDGNLGSELVDPPKYSVFPINDLDDQGVRQGISGGPARKATK